MTSVHIDKELQKQSTTDTLKVLKEPSILRMNNPEERAAFRESMKQFADAIYKKYYSSIKPVKIIRLPEGQKANVTLSISDNIEDELNIKEIIRTSSHDDMLLEVEFDKNIGWICDTESGLDLICYMEPIDTHILRFDSAQYVIQRIQKEEKFIKEFVAFKQQSKERSMYVTLIISGFKFRINLIKSVDINNLEHICVCIKWRALRKLMKMHNPDWDIVTIDNNLNIINL